MWEANSKVDNSKLLKVSATNRDAGSQARHRGKPIRRMRFWNRGSDRIERWSGEVIQ